MSHKPVTPLKSSSTLDAKTGASPRKPTTGVGAPVPSAGAKTPVAQAVQPKVVNDGRKHNLEVLEKVPLLAKLTV